MDALKNVLQIQPKVRSSVSTMHSWKPNDYYHIIAIVITIYVVSFLVWCRKKVVYFFNNLFNFRIEHRKESLVKAIIAGDFIETYKIIKKYKIINCILTSDGYTPLLIAAQYHKTQILKFLIQNGADLNAITSKGENAFYLATYSHIANMRRRDAGCIHALFHAGVDINFPTRQGYTALHLAAYCGHKTLVTWLLMKKAKMDLIPHPQMLARSQGHYETASLLNPKFYK